jgi:hypothetical protein
VSRAEDLVTPERLLHAGRIEQFRRAIPAAASQVAQVVVDNPGSFVLIASGSMVITQAAFNLVRPKTPGQVLALFAVLMAGLPRLGTAALEKGWITFRVRGPDGSLVPLVIGQAEADVAAEA